MSRHRKQAYHKPGFKRPPKAPINSEDAVLKKKPPSRPAQKWRGWVWQLSKVDTGGNWAWTALEQNGEEFSRVMKKLGQFEMKNWSELIRAKCHHWDDLSKLPKQAKNRLEKIDRDDIDEIISFRIDGRKRVWCNKIEGLMQLLWWDPDHSVYPVEVDRQDRAKRHKRR